MKYAWFRPWGFICSRYVLWVCLLLLVAIFAIAICTAVLQNNPAVNDDLYPVFGCGTSTAFWW